MTATEQKLAELWGEVLDTSPPSDPNDDFFARGGDSVAMLTLEFRINEEFAVEIPAGTVLQASTIRELSQIIDMSTRRVSKQESQVHSQK